MARRSIFAFVVVVLAMLALAAPALAGGWAMVTLDLLPREVRAGEASSLASWCSSTAKRRRTRI